MSELALDHSERVLDLGSYAGRQSVELIGQLAKNLRPVECGALARAHRDGPSSALRGVWALVGTLVARIAESFALLPAQQRVGLDHVADVARGTAHGVREARFGVHAE